MIESLNIGALVAALPEKYQPIFAHPELSDGSSRGCEDRLVLIRQCAQRLQHALGRPLRVLDLGCAQGFFSLNLAADGHTVHGVDFLDLNVNVCKALAAENPACAATFEHGTVEDVIDRLEHDECDLVLGLSVFHHLIHDKGIMKVSALCRKLSETTSAGIYELALREEPLYWAPSLSQDPAELLSSYAFLRLLSQQQTHLSAVSRPLYFASSRFWYVDGAIGNFTSWSSESHAHGRGTHLQSRRYYFSEQSFVKKMTLGVGDRAEINLQEFVNEVEFLGNPPESYPAPRLIASLNDSRDLFIARSMMNGRLLSQAIDDGAAYDADEIIAQILAQLVLLERAGLYHNDVRCWNILIAPEGRAVLIDYGAISANPFDCSWLDDLLLSFLITVKEILERKVVPSSPSREPALDFMTLPARYRNAFIGFFGQNRSPLTFALLQQCLQQADATPHSAPEWVTIYQRLQKALLGYNARLSAVHIETEHHRVELAARGAAIEHLRDSTLQDQERTQAFEQGVAAAEERYKRLEEESEKLAAWAKGLEAQTIESNRDKEALAALNAELESDKAALATRIASLGQELEERQRACELAESRAAELESDKAALATRIASLGQELEDRQRARELAELLAADVGRLTEERDAARSDLLDTQSVVEQHQATITALEARVAVQQQQISGLESSRDQERNRLRELQVDLSRSMDGTASAREYIRELEMAVEALEGQINSLHGSRSWRVTAPLRLFTTRVLKRGNADAATIRKVSDARFESPVHTDGVTPTPAEAAMDERLAAVDQLGSRIRKSLK
ncbi:methyltransferase domain-containing protein [Xanthomonas campestris]|uniref:methyltransferase domain-containing protein n=1 Tax=Xanthomonas campestris TaxID=339 RepID=UPI002B23D8A0|nr:methyltransferase domain-containing protein [Xanthomonas campestris]MEB2181404.1 methyltransferase domain-containing protein [Xanthomonas campestris pv. campestris]MEA9754969.1 methyltransferase domain-containing protein [Xanthomonas campestris pv. raphani]MEA9762625.1 methyltransferase domain-containing protein [Xanthomonas campestris pv. raphani]MEA9815058.1 methyltransferase domain-containing protein [Xanthomonas campestris pv. raphani]MEA9908190.1 methyltransferase domain-containing pro